VTRIGGSARQYARIPSMTGAGFARALALLTVVALAPPVPARAEIPEPGLREQHWSLEAGSRHFQAGRFDQALGAFEAAAREGPAALPPAALRQWGIAASEAGWPLAAWIRLHQYLATPEAAAAPAGSNDGLAARVERARAALAAGAVRRSRVVAIADRRDFEEPAERLVVRLVGRDGVATVEALGRVGRTGPAWERAGEIAIEVYRALVMRLLEAPAVIADHPVQVFDPNAPGPRRAVALRIVVGDEERGLQALRGAPYEAIQRLVALVTEFARVAPPSTLSPEGRGQGEGDRDEKRD
jgi:hypothetical protein